MTRKLIIASLFVVLVSVLSAHDLEGVVLDSQTGEPLIGSVIRLHELPDVATTTGLDGTFSLRHLPNQGHYTLVISYASYKTHYLKLDFGHLSSQASSGKSDALSIRLVEDAQQLGEVVVTARKEKHSDRSAVELVKNASNVLNAMSQQSIQLSPDISVSNVLQRVSGVTLEQGASDNASYAILRGMDKRYNYTLVNGVKIPSPDDKNRYIPLNIFPSDLMDRLVVAKSLTADMEGDAAGGVVDMVMKDAPSKLQLQVHAATGVSDYFWQGSHDYLTTHRSDHSSRSPYETLGSDHRAEMSDFRKGPTQVRRHALPSPNFIGGLSLGNRFWNDRLGLMLATSVQNTFRGTERTYNSVKMASGQQAMYIYNLQRRLYSTHDMTSGTHAKLDLSLGNHQLEWYNMYIYAHSQGVRYNSSISTEYITADSYTQDDEMRSSEQIQNILATHLRGRHRWSPGFTVDWAGIYSQARAEDPDKTYLTLTNSVSTMGASSSDADSGSLWDNDNTILKTLPKGMERRYQHNKDADLAGYIHLSQLSRLEHNVDILWKTGAQYRRKERANRYYSYLFNPANISQKLNDNSFSQYSSIDWVCRTPYSQASQLNYDSQEHVGAVYAMANVHSTLGELNFGFRAEHTHQVYTMLQKFRNMGQMGAQSYWDCLPSASLKWTPTSRVNLRLSYYRSINRPSFYEIVPYQVMGEEYQEKGNPSLRRARIDNLDLRWEWFPSATEQVMAGVFYKYLHDPIEQVFVTSDGRIGSGTDAYYMPDNLGDARNFGFEVDVIKYIRHFGFKANYTYTHSSITTSKREYQPGSAEYKTGVTQTRPLANQVPHVANLSLLYRDTRYGWNAQLAASYNSSRLALVSPFKDADQWDRYVFGLDLSAEKQFAHGISLFLKANNLLNTRHERYLRTVHPSNVDYDGQRPGRTVVSSYRQGRTLLLGFRYTL